MRKTIAVLLVCLSAAHSVVAAAEAPAGVEAAAPSLLLSPATLAAAVLAAEADVARPISPQAPASRQQKSGGHPVLYGMLIGAGTGAVLGVTGSSCSVSDEEARAAGFSEGPCGNYRLEGGLLGGIVGAGLGALIGLLFRR